MTPLVKNNMLLLIHNFNDNVLGMALNESVVVLIITKMWDFLPDKCAWPFQGVTYIGTVNVTTSGKPCLYWLDKTLDIHYADEQFADGSAELAKNYCRNPYTPGVSSPKPWCFVASKGEKQRSDISAYCSTCLGKDDYAGKIRGCI